MKWNGTFLNTWCGKNQLMSVYQEGLTESLTCTLYAAFRSAVKDEVSLLIKWKYIKNAYKVKIQIEECYTYGVH